MKGTACLLLTAALAAQSNPHGQLFRQADENGLQFAKAAAAMRKLMLAWLAEADPRTGLLPERIPGLRGLKDGDTRRRYTPHNSGADLYPYLVLTAELTDGKLYRGRMLEMLRNEIRYATAADAMPADLDFQTGRAGEMSLFGAAEYAKDGLLAVTELLGRTPWFFRMADLTAGIMKHAPVDTRWGTLPGTGAEINGDVLQVLARLIPMTGEERYRQWARGIADAYIHEVLPGCGGLPCMNWDFSARRGDGRVQLRDHGNEMVAGLALIYALEHAAGSERASLYRPVVERMLRRILESANQDGMLFDAIEADSLRPVRQRLSDNWGYLYGAMYTYYQVTGDTRYRDAVRHVLSRLGNYRNYDWENGSFDGLADSIESALYLVNREPSADAGRWIDAEMEALLGRQLPSGMIEHWYGEGNFNRTVYLYALAKSQGCRPDRWVPGLQVGAVRIGEMLHLSLDRPAVIRFDFARHRRVLQLSANYVRLNEFPEWFTVEENRRYRLTGPAGADMVRRGAELIQGVPLEAGNWLIDPIHSKVKVLILSGRNNHDWKTTSPRLREILEKAGGFDVQITEAPAELTAASLEPYQVLVSDYNGPRWGATAEQAVLDFVRSGKGFVATHAAIYAFGEMEILGDRHVRTGIYQPPWREYAEMMGAHWSAAAPKSGHGKRHTFPVMWRDRAHPVASGFGESFAISDELYHNLRVRPGNQVLAAAYDAPEMNGTGNEEPMAWVRPFGRGRVFYTALGHDVEAMKAEGFAKMLAQAVAWAAGAEKEQSWSR